MKYIAINGSSLSQNITGIGRYMYEIIRRIDIIDDPKEIKIYLLCPRGTNMHIPTLNNIECVELDHKNGKIKTCEIIRFLKNYKAKYVSLSGNICIQRNSIICIHDIRPWIYKKYDPLKFRIRCGINFISSKLFAGLIVTVSETSKNEIVKYLRVNEKRVIVIPNGWNHMDEIEEDTGFWQNNPPIQKGEYIYSLSSVYPHKNFIWVIENAKRNPSLTYVIGGGGNKVMESMEIPSNVIFLGYVTDELNKTLMKNCKAFVHPSFYEGFGITPLEALACGASIIVSDILCLKEIFGGVAVFFNPLDYDFDITNSLNEVNDEDKLKLLEKYSWDKSAQAWYSIFSRNL